MTPLAVQVLLVEGDPLQRAQVSGFLVQSGYGVEAPAPEADWLAPVEAGRFGCVLLDRDLVCPGALDVLCRIRQCSPVPVLMRVGPCEDVERVLCLELGADDVLPKAGSLRELVARIRAIQRRMHWQWLPSEQGGGSLQAGALVLWPQKRSACWHGQALNLTSTEYSLLEQLVRHQGRPVSKQMLYEQVLCRPHQRHDRTIDVHMSNIRHKLGMRADGQAWIQTVRGFGYQLVRE